MRPALVACREDPIELVRVRGGSKRLRTPSGFDARAILPAAAVAVEPSTARRAGIAVVWAQGQRTCR